MIDRKAISGRGRRVGCAPTGRADGLSLQRKCVTLYREWRGHRFVAAVARIPRFVIERRFVGILASSATPDEPLHSSKVIRKFTGRNAFRRIVVGTAHPTDCPVT